MGLGNGVLCISSPLVWFGASARLALLERVNRFLVIRVAFCKRGTVYWPIFRDLGSLIECCQFRVTDYVAVSCNRHFSVAFARHSGFADVLFALFG